MKPIQSCAGGWCARRDSCAHYHAASPLHTPSERLCPTGREDSTLPAYEAIVTMKKAPAGTIYRDAKPETGRPKGFALLAVQELVDAAGARGLTIVEARAKLKDQNEAGIKSAIHNLVNRYGYRMMTGTLKCGVFTSPSVSVADAEAGYRLRVAEDKARQRGLAKAARKRYEARIAEETRAKRRGELEAAAKARAEHNAAVERDRLARQAQREEEARRKVQLNAARKAEAAANNRIAKRLKGDGTHGQPPKPKAPPTTTWGNVQVQKIPHQPGRYEVLEAAPVFSGRELLPAQSCMGRALS